MQQVTLQAPAKVNLCLKITGRRADGYHDIISLMQKVALADVLHLRLTDAAGIRLTCPGSGLPDDQDNLVWRAAQAFQALTAAGTGVDIVLEKRIPVAAGLGGGSSDAAAVLLGLNALCQTGLTSAELLALAAPLGADVPFFVIPETAAWATSIGECLRPSVPVGDGWFVLVNPGFAVSTRWAYENFALTSRNNPYILPRCREMAGSSDAWPLEDVVRLGNDLEAVTLARFPEIDAIKRKLTAAGAVVALMSGSGPTVFGFFAHHPAAVRCADEFSQQYGKNVFVVRPSRPR